MEFTNLLVLPLAYVGPGAGMGLLMALVGLVAAVGGAVFAVAWWPIRKLLKRRRQNQQPSA